MSRTDAVASGVGIALVVGLYAWRADQEVAPVQAAAPPRVGQVLELESRFTSPDVLEVWGAADVPDGTTVRLRLRRRAADGSGSELASTPVRGGRFVVTAAVPARLRGRAVTVSARLAD